MAEMMSNTSYTGQSCERDESPTVRQAQVPTPGSLPCLQLSILHWQLYQRGNQGALTLLLLPEDPCTLAEATIYQMISV